MRCCGLPLLHHVPPTQATGQRCRSATQHALLSSPVATGTWQHEVEAVDGKIVITRKDGSQAVLTYSEATSPAEVGAHLPWG